MASVHSIYVIVFLGWFLSTAVSIYLLINKRQVSDTAQAIWTLVILLIPFLGPAVFALVTNDKRTPR